MLIHLPVRSKCCEAPVRMGHKKLKKTNQSVSIWICCKCKKRDCDLLQYSRGKVIRSTYDDPFAQVDTDEPPGL